LVSGAVWDEPLTGNSHNIPTTSGRRLRALASTVITEGTADGNGNGYNQIILNGDALTTDGAYDPAMIAIVNGTGAGQCRNIFQYDGATKTATVDRNWKTQPDNTSEYVIYSDAGREHVNEGLARGGTLNTITLNELASSGCDAYVGQSVFIRSGYGDDQVRVVIAYDPVNKIATVEYPWNCIPNTTSAYAMLPFHVHPPAEIRDYVWNAPTSGYGVSGGTYGNLIQNTNTKIDSLSASNEANFTDIDNSLISIENKVDGISTSGGATPAQIAQAVWSENPSGYSGINNFGGLMRDMSEDLKRLLGLTHENIFIDNPTYDADGNMTGARVRIYSNPASVGTSNNIIGTYTISAPSSAPGQFISWQQVRTS
jgi:hypothetical protein